jgi:hypothetical protein
MCTSPDTGARADDRLVTVISQWLARHVSDGELLAALEQVDESELEPDQAEAVAELRSELKQGRSGAGLQMVARETLEALALGG